MATLQNWNFNDQTLNSTGPQVNRQKSAQNVTTVSIDTENKSGVFSDKRYSKVRASLVQCECKDFNFSGDSPRKKFAPCMHIYKLAMELGLFTNPNFDWRTRHNKENELIRMQNIPPDHSQWGNWAADVHIEPPQKVRQHRAYEILETNDSENNFKEYRIPSYETCLSSCMCPDFQERKLPCKHIYGLALLKNIKLPVTQEEYKKEKEQFKEDFVPLLTVDCSDIIEKLRSIIFNQPKDDSNFP